MNGKVRSLFRKHEGDHRGRSGRRALGAIVFVTPIVCAPIAVAVTTAPTAGASAMSPTVTVASGGGGVPKIALFTQFAPAVVGYEQSEVFLSGIANAYQPTGAFGSNGKLSVSVASTASYKTRALVMRPRDPRRFNGTVIVEWLNVTGGADAAADWAQAHNQLVRQGFAYVGVTAQKAGVDALKSSTPVQGVVVGDPVRYASLSHPGDSYSYDIFSQAGQAIRDHPNIILGGLKPKHLVAIGESQSAGRLVTYIDAVHPLVHVYNGFLVHSEFGTGAPLSQAPQPNAAVPSPMHIRDDLNAPVLLFETETDVFNSRLTDRQPDTKRFRLWEVAGTAHFDDYGLAIGLTDTGDGQGSVQVLQSMLNPPNQPTPLFTCSAPINTGPGHYVLDAAVFWVNQWVTTGEAPPIAPRLKATGTNPVTFATDGNGDVLGGIRTPAVNAPVATLSGLPTGQGGTSFCAIFGTTTPFTSAHLAALYANHGQFASKWGLATQSGRRQGFITGADARELIMAGVQSSIGK